MLIFFIDGHRYRHDQFLQLFLRSHLTGFLRGWNQLSIKMINNVITLLYIWSIIIWFINHWHQNDPIIIMLTHYCTIRDWWHLTRVMKPQCSLSLLLSYQCRAYIRRHTIYGQIEGIWRHIAIYRLYDINTFSSVDQDIPVHAI